MKDAVIQPNKQSVERRTLHALNTHGFAYVVEVGGATRPWHWMRKHFMLSYDLRWTRRPTNVFFNTQNSVYVHTLDTRIHMCSVNNVSV